MNKEIKLSICIGTFNRAKLISETLDSIFSHKIDSIEIIVVDGGSTDDTELVLSRYQEMYQNLLYIKLPTKGGFDQDYSLAVEASRGKYCWLFSDDDVMKAGAIDKVMENVEFNYDGIIVNAEIRDSTLSKILKSRCMEIDEDGIYTSDYFEQFFIDTAAHTSFIGAVIIKRSIWNARNKGKYFGTLFVHVGVLFESKYKGVLKVISDPLVSIRYGNAMWTGRSFEISLLIWPNLIWGFGTVSDEAKSRVTQIEPWKNMIRLLYYRARGSYSLAEYHKFIKGNINSLKGFLALLIAIMPGTLLNYIFSIYFYMFNTRYANRRLILVDLENSIYHLGIKFSNKLA